MAISIEIKIPFDSGILIIIIYLIEIKIPVSKYTYVKILLQHFYSG